MPLTFTTCKFECTSKTERKGWHGTPDKVYDYKFQVVHGNNPENKAFFASTPGGHIEVTTVRDDSYEVGKEYMVDFREAIVVSTDQ